NAVGAEQREAAVHDCGVLLGRAGEPVVRRDARQIARHMHLREMAVSGEDQHALRTLAERKALLAVLGRDLGDDELPGPDDLLAEGLGRLCRRDTGADAEDEHGRNHPNGFHAILPEVTCPVFLRPPVPALTPYTTP